MCWRKLRKQSSLDIWFHFGIGDPSTCNWWSKVYTGHPYACIRLSDAWSAPTPVNNCNRKNPTSRLGKWFPSLSRDQMRRSTHVVLIWHIYFCALSIIFLSWVKCIYMFHTVWYVSICVGKTNFRMGERTAVGGAYISTDDFQFI